MMMVAAKPAEAQQRYIVRTTGGLNSVLNLCLSANLPSAGLVGRSGRANIPGDLHDTYAGVAGGV